MPETLDLAFKLRRRHFVIEVSRGMRVRSGVLKFLDLGLKFLDPSIDILRSGVWNFLDPGY